MNLGNYNINDTLTFTVNTHDPNTGGSKDADSPPEYRVYEENIDDPILAGEMGRLDDDNTVGFYVKQLLLSLSNNFKYDTGYEIRISATVTGSIDGLPITGVTIYQLRVNANVSSTVVTGCSDKGKLDEATLLDAAAKSSEIEVDNQRVKRRSVNELIALDKHLARRKLGCQSGFGGLGIIQTVPPAATGEG